MIGDRSRVKATLWSAVTGWRWTHAGTLCALCGDETPLPGGLCRGCRDDLPRAGHGCRLCALPLAGADLCGRCQRRPPPFRRVLAPFMYEPPVDALIHGAKYHQRLGDARALGVLLAEHVAAVGGELPALLVPVPLHRQRLRERGYNQALEIARPLARSLGLRLDPGCCIRVRATSPQARLGGRARRTNIAGAFAVVRVPQAAHVAIVDDVMTTGGTVAEMAAALTGSGIGRVDVWVCARASLPR